MSSFDRPICLTLFQKGFSVSLRFVDYFLKDNSVVSPIAIARIFSPFSGWQLFVRLQGITTCPFEETFVIDA